MKILTVLACVGFVIVIFSIFPAACTKPDETIRVLRDQGYTEIKITGYRPFMSDEDTFSTGFEAKSPNGRKVTGAVTSGAFKGNTIRLD